MALRLYVCVRRAMCVCFSLSSKSLYIYLCKWLYTIWSWGMSLTLIKRASVLMLEHPSHLSMLLCFLIASIRAILDGLLLTQLLVLLMEMFLTPTRLLTVSQFHLSA